MSKSYQTRKTVLIVCLGLILLFAVLGLTIDLQSDSHKVYAWGESVSTVDPDSDWLTKEYRDVYQLMPNVNFTYKFAHDAYGGYPLSNAFDGKFDTVFISKRVVSASTDVYIDIDFKQNATIDRIVYKSMSYNGSPSGFPTNLKVWYGVDSYTSNSVTFETWSATSDIVVFKFGEPITANRLRFQFVDVTVVNNSLSNSLAVPSAAEIMFFQPEHSSVDIVSDLFTDYRWTELNPKYANMETMALLRKELSGHANYQSAYLPRIERAEALLNGTAGYVEGREFATDDSNLKKITQYGNIINYARGTLKMDYAGTHKQPTGIYQNAGQTITVWVDAPDGVPLPGIDVAQYLNYCYNYQQSYSLSRGRNVITIPDFVNANSGFTYNRFTVSGGVVYITNPYTPNQQQGGVKVYIEGGYEFPLMTYDTEVEEYRAQLAEYSALVKSNPNDYADVTELICNHVILTIPASSASNTYATRDPSEVLDTWDTMVEDILTFEGVALESNGYKYDERVHHLNFNVRYVQAMGNYAAYAFPEIIGLVDFLPEAIRATTFGWGIPHEVGHLFDLSDRRLSETTNNVIAKFYETTHGTGSHGSFDMIRNTLTSDLADTTDFWSGHKGCFDFWWEIECVMPGYWAKFENFYRYEDRKGLANTELMAYFSSLATGIDMSYYFERWGYFFGSDQPFKYANTSGTYKSVMAQAKAEGKFTDAKQYKIWYANNNTYNYVVNDGAGLYTDAYKPSISSVVKVGGGYKIILPTSTDSAHYGYEILQGNDQDGYKVIGFTEGYSFIDSTSYESGYVPSYRIVAYDKRLECSSPSDAVAAEVNTDHPVCRINQINYGSLQEALYAAVAGDTIYLLDDIWELDLQITLNLTIVIADSVTKDITITKGGNGVLFDMQSGVRLTLQGSANNKLILDGDSFGGGPLINGNGATINCSYVEFTNCKSSGEGGAIAIRNGTLTVDNCEFVDCIASDGGAIYADSTTTTITSCRFEDCHAEEGNASGYARGGAIYLVDCGSKKVTISSTTITNCSAEANSGQSICNGGAMYIQNCASVTLNGTTITGCNANHGGGIYVADYSTLTVTDSTISYNTATGNGGGIYVTNSSNLSVVSVTLTQNHADNNGGAICVASADCTLAITKLTDVVSMMSYNTAGNYGGAVACVGTIAEIKGFASTNAQNAKFENNSAQYGGAVAVLDGGKVNNIQYTTMMSNSADYGGAIYLAGSASFYDSVTLRNNSATTFGGSIYFKGGENDELKFNASYSGGRPMLGDGVAPIGYELYMESGRLNLMAITFSFNYAMKVIPNIKYSLYVNGGHVTLGGIIDVGVKNDAALVRDIFISENATVNLTTAMFTANEFYEPFDPPTTMPLPGTYYTYNYLHITYGSFDFDYVKAIFTADFEIPQDALQNITFVGLDESMGHIEIRGNTVCYVPNRVKVTLDYGDGIGAKSFDYETGTDYTFTADGFEEQYVGKYIISFIVDGITYQLGDTIRIDDATVIHVVVGQKYKVTIRYGDEEEYIYVKPGEKFIFPADSSFVDSADIIRWEYNGRYYMIGDEIDVTGDIVISPVDKKWIETNLEAKINELKNATTLQAKFDAIKDVENILALLTEEEINELDLDEFNALKASFDSLSASVRSDLEVAEKIGASLVAKAAEVVALAAIAAMILKRRILG